MNNSELNKRYLDREVIGFDVITNAILKNKDWLFHTFMNKPDLQKIRDGKKQSELVCKALDKVMNLSDLKGTFSFVEELHRLEL